MVLIFLSNAQKTYFVRNTVLLRCLPNGGTKKKKKRTRKYQSNLPSIPSSCIPAFLCGSSKRELKHTNLLRQIEESYIHGFDISNEICIHSFGVTHAEMIDNQFIFRSVCIEPDVHIKLKYSYAKNTKWCYCNYPLCVCVGSIPICGNTKIQLYHDRKLR